MADDPVGEPEESGRGFWPNWLTPRRGVEFARNVIALEKSVGQLRDENRAIRREVDNLQRQMTEHNAKLQMLIDFVQNAVSERIDTRTELVVRRLLEPKLGNDEE